MATNNTRNMKLWADLNYLPLGDQVRVNIQTVGIVPLLKHAIREGGQLYETKVEGAVAEKPENFLAHVEKLGGKLLHKRVTGGPGGAFTFTWENSVMDLSLYKSYLTMEVASLDEKFVVDARTFFSNFILPPKTQGHVYAIISSGGRLAMSNLGNAGIPLVEKNYTDKVLADFKYVIEDLNSSYPSGRLAIMEGEPGTGKTHLVRAALNEVSRGMFVLVPPEMVKDLGGPQLLPLLMQYHAYHAGPIVLILEDADKCLVTRTNGEADVGVIQSILNLGDGIMGSMLDIRIIATTNAKKFEMDAAVLRRGRLSKQIHVGPLDEKAAIRAYNNLLPDAALPAAFLEQLHGSPNHEMPLSDVYGIARDNGWKPKPAAIDPDEDEDDDLIDDD